MENDFAPVPDFPGYYVTRDGRVWSTWKMGCKPRPDAIAPRVLKHATHQQGYHQVCLRKDGVRFKVYVHEVVLRCFVGPRPDGLDHIRHVNGNPGDNRVENLVYGTASENSLDMVRHGRGRRKLSDDDVRVIRAEYQKGNCRALAERYGVSMTQIRRAVKRMTYGHLE